MPKGTPQDWQGQLKRRKGARSLLRSSTRGNAGVMLLIQSMWPAEIQQVVLVEGASMDLCSLVQYRLGAGKTDDLESWHLHAAWTCFWNRVVLDLYTDILYVTLWALMLMLLNIYRAVSWLRITIYPNYHIYIIELQTWAHRYLHINKSTPNVESIFLF